MPTILHLPASFTGDLETFRAETDRFRQGAVSAAEYRSFRVPRGVYEQRESDTYMLRARCPAGVVLPHQLRALADVSRQYGNGVLHVTTRQDIQVHRVLLDDLHSALCELHAAGLSTRGGGGNTVRNITGCADAGVCAAEVFDVSPYVVAMTEALLPDPLSYQLPRKYKLAFSGCARDCAGATVNDLGFIAKKLNGIPGFAVYVGGGMGADSRVGQLFEPFVPAGQIHLVAEAVKRVFDQHGNRKNRNRARLRFLIEQIGWLRFRELYQLEFEGLRPAQQEGLQVRPLPASPPAVSADQAELAATATGCDAWRGRNTLRQRQDAYFLIHIPLTLGDIDAGTLEQLADVVERHGERMVRATQTQNLVLRWVHESELTALHAKLAGLGLAEAQLPVLRDMVACTGAATCKLGICLSRGLARAVADELAASAAGLTPVQDLRLHISGCPNGCGRHAIADIGLHGVARRVNDRLVPHDVIQVGGTVAEGETQFAEGQQAVPARSLPALLRDVLQAFAAAPQAPDFRRFLAAGGRQLVESLAERYRHVPDFEAGPDYYRDWGADTWFSLAGRGPGECGAGVFDLISVDLQSAREALSQQRLREAVVLAARALLVTRGQQANSETEAVELFRQYFVDERLVDAKFGDLITRVRHPQPDLAGEADEAARFVETIEKLYASMDASLRFRPSIPESAPASATSVALPAASREADFRGVVCPLNYVKTKLLLGQMHSSETLTVLLDEPGTRNVPDSVRKDGHRVLSITPEGDHWRLVIQKA